MFRKKRTTVGISAAIAVAFIFVLYFIISFCVSLPPYGETYIGKLSDATYATADAALSDFTFIELSGKTTSAKFLGYKSVRSATADEIDKFDLNAENFKSVEKVKLEYEIDGEIYSCELYVCMLENNAFKYFTPPLFTGERLTKSYYDSVVNNSDFENCTLKFQSTSAMKIAGVPIKNTVNYTMKVCGDIAYYSENSSFLGIGASMEIYAFDAANGVKYITRQNVDMGAFESIFGDVEDAGSYDTGWLVLNSDEVALPFSAEISSVSEFSLFGLYKGVDHTYYEKTRTGFAVAPDKLEEFTDIAVQNSANRLFNLNDYDDNTQQMLNKMLNQAKWNFNCNYVVNEGHLRQAFLKSSVDMSTVDWKNVMGIEPPEWFLTFFKAFAVEMSAQCDIVDIGSTSFEVNEEVEKLIKRYR